MNIHDCSCFFFKEEWREHRHGESSGIETPLSAHMPERGRLNGKKGGEKHHPDSCTSQLYHKKSLLLYALVVQADLD